ncbi:MAG: hypothetical protein HOW73_20450 [Polyangiaceae bacterium]|nr:hypothetical protein [Polyangiaceae bacterium]
MGMISFCSLCHRPMRRHISREAGKHVGTGVCVIDCEGSELKETRRWHPSGGVYIEQEIRREEHEEVVRG